MKPQNQKVSFIHSIKGQMVIFFLTVSLIPLLLVGLLLYNQANTALKSEATNKLVIIRDIKAKQIEDYFKQSLADVNVFAKDMLFVVSAKNLNDSISQIMMTKKIPSEEAMAGIRPLYLGKPDLDNAGDIRPYSITHARSHSVLKDYINHYGYYDLLIAEPTQGTIIYSVRKDSNYGTSLEDAMYANTSLAYIYQKAITANNPDFTIFGDVGYYGNSLEPGLFVASPIFVSSNKMVGVLILQLKIERINTIMAEGSRVGKTAETYLVGPDKLMRSDLVLAKKSTIFKRKVNTISVNQALAGQTDVILEDDYKGTPVLTAFKPLNIQKTNWVILSQIDQAEAFDLSRQMLSMTLIAMGIAAVVVALLAVFIANKITGPLVEVTKVARDVSTINLPETSEMILLAKDDLMRTLTIQGDILNIKSNDEIGQMAQTFIQMTANLRHLVDKLTGEEVLRQAKETAEAANRAKSELLVQLEASYIREQKRRELSDTLREVTKIISSTLEPEKVLDLMLTQLNHVVMYHFATVTLLNEGNLTLVAGRNVNGVPMESFTIRADQYPLNAMVLREKQPLVMPDVRQDSRWTVSEDTVLLRSFINAPLLVRDDPIGLLFVGRNDEIPYTEDDAQTVFAFAMQTSIALKNARLLEEIQTALRETDGLFKAVRAFLGSDGLTEICRYLTMQFNNLVQAHGVVIYLVDHKLKQISLTMYDGNLDKDSMDIAYEKLNQGISGLVFRSGQPILSVSADDGIEPAETKEERKRKGIGALIVAPLVAREQIIGTVTAFNRIDQRKFTPHDVDLLMALAAQAATAIDNVRLYTVAQQELAERKRAEAALQKANDKLVKMNADKNKFFSIVAHDLKGPFQPLLGLAEFLPVVVDKLDRKQIKEMSESIYSSAKNVFRLLENLLQWARMQQGRINYVPAKLELKQIADQSIELLTANAMDKGVILRNEVIDELMVFADENMLNTVIRNLISNALKFTPSGGQVTVKSSNYEGVVEDWGNYQSEPEDELEDGAGASWPPTANNFYPQQLRFIEVWVADTGVGMKEQDRQKLFKIDVHHSTLGTAKEQGTGLGLIICKEMVEKNRGKIWVESEFGKGTAVKFTVPLDSSTPLEILTEMGNNGTGEQPEASALAVETHLVEPSLADFFIVPSPQEMNNLFTLVMQGDIDGIQRWAVQTKQQDERFVPFTDKLQELAKGFEEEEILALVQSYIT